MALDGELCNVEIASAVGLTYAHEGDPGIRRIRAGKGFTYKGPDGATVRDPSVLDRIRRLAIPPAYTDVWISADPDSHVQATGRDEKGRKQYRYHDRWRAIRDESKFARMAAFGRALPRLRERVEHDLRRPGLPREKVLAAVVRLLELTLIRVGNDEYAAKNKSFGLTTLRKRHVDIEGAGVVFEFRGKSGKDHKTSFRDRRLARILKQVQELRGQRLFQYVDQDGTRHPIESADVNRYIHEAMGEDVSAKDFRTWAGTVSAAKALAMQPPAETEAQLKRLVSTCVKATAGLLGNTPTVCRASYIHPGVIQAFADRRLPEAFAHLEGRDFEEAVIEFLDALSADVERQTGLSRAAQEQAAA